MSTNEKADQAKTYILNETAFTKSKSLEELAEIAAGQIADAGTVGGDSRDGSEADPSPGRVEGSRREHE